jgi:hypothetical protein
LEISNIANLDSVEVGGKLALVLETSLDRIKYYVKALMVQVRLNQIDHSPKLLETLIFTEWCCNAEYEKCITDPGAINLCMTQFASPYANVTEDEALSLKSSFFATASSTTSTTLPKSTSSTSKTSSPTSSTTQAVLSQAQSGAAVTPSPTSTGACPLTLHQGIQDV